MPPLLKHALFVQSYGLEGDGINPYRFKKDEVDEQLVIALFGRPCGKGGRVGYRWNDCKNVEVVERINSCTLFSTNTL
jgi:hypothetical protein